MSEELQNNRLIRFAKWVVRLAWNWDIMSAPHARRGFPGFIRESWKSSLYSEPLGEVRVDLRRYCGCDKCAAIDEARGEG